MKKVYLIIPLFFLSIFVLGLALLNRPLNSPIVGDVTMSSSAYTFGFRPGDRILSIDGLDVPSWEFFLSEVLSRQEKESVVKVDRFLIGETKLQGVIKTGNLAFLKFGFIEGISSLGEKPVIGLKTNSILSRYGVETGYVLAKVNRITVQNWHQIESAIRSQNQDLPLNLDFIHFVDGKAMEHSIAIPTLGSEYSAALIGIEDPSFHVKSVSPRSIAQKLGIKPKDRILLVQGKPNSRNLNVAELIQQIKASKFLDVVVVREDRTHFLKLEISDNIFPDHSGPLPKFLGYDSYAERSAAPLPKEKDVYLKFKSLIYPYLKSQ